ncbi:unnamed protein product [Mesocestoides corti]|uniref:FCH domain-containing protein n=1 Tax=Mesocestoides corti TaxID=53468 RepID=A0A0R3U2T5_MESCO|nr:unnamed protein product [Mesocestoides corti]
MNSPGFDASGFIRKLSLRKKKWPDDYLSGGAPKTRRGSTGQRSYPSPTSPYSPSFFAPFGASPPPPPQPLTSHALAELRTQFADQIKCLDAKLDLDVTVMSELHEFYRRRALVEQEYSDALAKLVNSLKHKHSCETGKSLWRVFLVQLAYAGFACIRSVVSGCDTCAARSYASVPPYPSPSLPPSSSTSFSISLPTHLRKVIQLKFCAT